MKNRNEICKFFSSIPNINSGGCLIAAYAFFLHEKKWNRHHNIQIVALDKYQMSHRCNSRYIDGKSDYAESAAHFGWTFDSGQNVYDCEGLVNQKPYKYKLCIPKVQTDDFCVNSLTNGCWNWMFRREKHIPQIEQYLNVDLSRIKEDNSDMWY